MRKKRNKIIYNNHWRINTHSDKPWWFHVLLITPGLYRLPMQTHKPGAEVVVQWVKHRPVLPACYIASPVRSSSLLVHREKQQKVSLTVWTPAPMWEAQMGLLAPDLGLAQIWLLWSFGEWSPWWTILRSDRFYNLLILPQTVKVIGDREILRHRHS